MLKAAVVLMCCGTNTGPSLALFWGGLAARPMFEDIVERGAHAG